MTHRFTTPAPTRGSRRVPAKAGLSLLEVMIATGIMAASSMALLRLGRLGNEHALRSESLSEVVMLAQNKLHALEAGIEPLEPAEHQPFADHADWDYTLHAKPETAPGLWRVTIAVFARQPALGFSADAGSADPNRPVAADRPVSPRQSHAASTDESQAPRWSLTQWIRCAPPTAAEGTVSAEAPRPRRFQLDRGGAR